MDHPTRQEFDELKEQVRKLKEQRQTEPISLTDSALLQTLVIMAGTQATDIGVIKQALERQEKRFDAIAKVQELILERLPGKGE